MPRKATRKGQGVLDSVKKAASAVNKFAKDNKLISKALNAGGYNNLARGAAALGYGRKRKKKRGGSFLGDILGRITSIPAGILMGGTMGAQQAINGLGRRGGNRLQPYLPTAVITR